MLISSYILTVIHICQSTYTYLYAQVTSIYQFLFSQVFLLYVCMFNFTKWISSSDECLFWSLPDILFMYSTLSMRLFYMKSGGFLDETCLVAQAVSELPAIREIQVRFLGQEDSLDKGMTTHSNVFDWRIPWRYLHK